MRRTIAIIAGGDSSELPVSLRSAQGLYSFMDKERYQLYIVEMEGRRWEVHLPNGSVAPIDKNDFSFIEDGKKKKFSGIIKGKKSKVESLHKLLKEIENSREVL